VGHMARSDNAIIKGCVECGLAFATYHFRHAVSTSLQGVARKTSKAKAGTVSPVQEAARLTEALSFCTQTVQFSYHPNRRNLQQQCDCSFRLIGSERWQQLAALELDPVA
jgi:hypothetical protein